MTTAAPPQAVASPTVHWLGLRLVLPAGCAWEIVRHSTSLRKGSLVFADRTRQRMQLTWTACANRPDVARLLADHRARQREQNQHATFTTPLLPAGWRGVQRQTRDGTLTRAARYDTKTSRLIELVLDADPPSPDDSDPQNHLLHDLLTHLTATSPADAAIRFAAFGLDVTVPPPFQLATTRIQPADAKFVFSTRPAAKESEKYPSLTIRRRAMAEVWFDGNLRNVLQQHAPRVAMRFLLPSLEGGAGGGCRPLINDGPVITPGHPPLTPPSREGDQKKLHRVSDDTVTATWNVPGPRARRLLNFHRVAIAAAWVCPVENSVYDAIAVGPAKCPPTFEGLSVACAPEAWDD